MMMALNPQCLHRHNGKGNMLWDLFRGAVLADCMEPVRNVFLLFTFFFNVYSGLKKKETDLKYSNRAKKRPLGVEPHSHTCCTRSCGNCTDHNRK